MLEKVGEEIRMGEQSARPIRYLAEEACWKRGVYSFTLANTRDAPTSYSLERLTEALILSDENRRLPRSPSFAVNPFHWVFSALDAGGDWKTGRTKIFRFGRQLLYAKEHAVPEEFLIGFLHQVGTPSEVEKKVASGTTEIWKDGWLAARHRFD